MMFFKRGRSEFFDRKRKGAKNTEPQTEQRLQDVGSSEANICM
jgi:hypothetical protein